MLAPVPLSRAMVAYAERTMSPSAFYAVATSALLERAALSVVRMGDGERHLLDDARDHLETGEVAAPDGMGIEWLMRMGCASMPRKEMVRRLQFAAKSATYFAPSITGLINDRFALYDALRDPRRVYLDNFFVNTWTDEQRIALYQRAGHVLFIHRNAHTADSLQLRLQGQLGVKVDYIALSDWRETIRAEVQAYANTAPLVLVSAGPAGKYIIPMIADRGGKVVLDLGNAADHWTLEKVLPIDRPAAEAFAARWRASHQVTA